MVKDLTQGGPAKTVLAFTLPIIGGNLFQLFYTLADTVIVGRTMGAGALAAVGSTGTFIYFILCFVQGLTGGFGICIGQRFGARSEVGVRRSVAASALLSLFFTVVLTLFGCFAAHPIIRWMDTPPEIYEMSYEYLFVIMLGTGAAVAYNLVSNVLRALGDSRTPLYFLIFSSFLNIVLDYVFIVPFGMGVAGAAWATVLSQLLSAVLCALYGVRNFRELRVPELDWRRSPLLFKNHLRLAFPMGFQMSVMCVGLIAMQTAVNGLGAEVVAGFTAATKVDQLSVLVNGAFGVAIAGYVAQNYGAGLGGRIKAGVRASLIQLEAANLVMGAVMLLGRRFVVPLFVDGASAAINEAAYGYLFVVVPFYPLLGLLIIYRSALQSMDDARTPFAACIAELVMRVAAAFLLARFFGYAGICFATPLAWMGALAFLVPVWLRRASKLEAEASPFHRRLDGAPARG